MEKEGEQNQGQNQDDSGFFGQSQQRSNQSKQKEEEVESKGHRTHKKKGIRKQNKTGNKPKVRKEKNNKDEALKQTAQDIAQNLIQQMDKRYDDDLKLYGRKPATEKISYIQTLKRELRNVYVCQQFLELNGLSMFEKWLRKLPDGHQPNLNLRKHLFEILQFLRVRQDHISKAQELQRIIQRNKKSQTKQIRDLCEIIIGKWSKITYYDINQ